ncbi:MAG: hypothetical protein ACXVQU_01620 [Actinomycetota bacterium]
MTARARALLAVGLVALILVAVVGIVEAAPVRADVPPVGRRQAYLFIVRDATLGDLLTGADVRRLVRSGGGGWLSPPLDVRRLVGDLKPNADPDLMVRDLGPESPKRIGDRIRVQVPSTPGVRVLVIVVGVSPSQAMRANHDDLRPVVVATAPADRLYWSRASIGTITSDSTRRIGIVSANDVEATVDAFLGRSTSGDAGHAIRIVNEAPPFDLHERYVAMRRMTIPVQTTAALYVTIAGLFAVGVLWLGRRAPAVLGVMASAFAISVGPLAAALLAAGHLPSLSYATVVPFVVVVTLVLVAFVLLGATREGVMHPILPLAIALLAFLLIEDLLGWTGALTPFLGGSELDGGRFFGLPNVFIGLLLGAGLYAAARLPAWAGFVVLVGAALLAGLPFAGANLGGAVTLFAAAGLWLPLRARGRLRVPELTFAALVVVIGTGVVLVAHRCSSLPTHVTTFEETRGTGGAWSTFVDRLAVGWHLIEHNPFALVPVVGMLVTLGVVLRPPATIGPSLARHPAWRDALLVLLLSSVVAYIVNDSGPAACGVGFGMALGGLLYVSVAERTWKMAPV